MDSTRSSHLQLMRQLLERRLGATVNELAAAVCLSRTAVNQHLKALERDGLVGRSLARRTAGRPQQIYILTEAGIQQFPKQYSWFSRQLIGALRQEMGEERAAQFMYNLGIKMSGQLRSRLVGKTESEALHEIVKIMNETGFVAKTVPSSGCDRGDVVEFKNCVYSDLSKEHPAVCRFDIGLLSGLTGRGVEHQSCMQRGSESCRFRIPTSLPTPEAPPGAGPIGQSGLSR